MSDLNSLDGDYIIRSIDAASNAVKKLESEYGVEYNFDEKSLKSFESKLEDIISKVESEYKVSLDSAERLIKSFKSISDSIDSKVISATGTYGDYSSAESYVKDFDKHIQYAVRSAENYKKWAKSGETDKAKELMISFKDLVSKGIDRHNIMMYKSALDEIIDEWSNIKSKWSSRKRKEEDRRSDVPGN